MVFISHIFHVFHDFALEICAEKPIILNTLNDLEIERMSDTTKSATRPLSPHLQVYRLPMTALMSISHRITGVILAGGCLLVVLFFIGAALGKEEYDYIMGLAATPAGMYFMMAWSFVLYYHLCNGVRHLIWDTVHLLDQDKAIMAGWVVLLTTAGLTAATWYYAGFLEALK
jgi:succinate dehydrogenase / fumarate reductase cytochrome b subunit